jgi:TonB family protein
MVLAMLGALSIVQASIPAGSITPFDVPIEIARTAPTGVESFQLVVSPEGAIVACHVRVIGRGAVDDGPNCKRLLKLKAVPASDQEGHPIHGMVEIKVVWQMYRTGQAPALPVPAADSALYLQIRQFPSGVAEGAHASLLLVVGADGKVEACQISRSSGHNGLDDAACQAVMARGVEPLKDKAGGAIRGVQNSWVGFEVRP